MRLILTETQLKLIETIINEASTPMSTKIEKGGFIQVVYLVGDTEKSQTLEITEVHGGGKFITGTNKGGSFIVNVGGSLNTTNNTFTVLKGAEYKSGGKTDGGNITGEEIIGGTRMVVKNVTQVNISDAGKNVVDELYTDLGDREANSGGKTDKSKGVDVEDQHLLKMRLDKEREKRIYKKMMDDPIYKKAFYHQPKLFGGLLNYGKAKGVGPAMRLASKYLGGYNLGGEDGDIKGKEAKEFSDFKVNKSVIYQVSGKPIRISYGSEDFILEVGKSYPSRYVGKQYLKGKIGGITYKIYMKEKVGGNTYKGTVKAFFKEDDGSVVDKMDNITITVKDYNY